MKSNPLCTSVVFDCTQGTRSNASPSGVECVASTNCTSIVHYNNKSEKPGQFVLTAKAESFFIPDNEVLSKCVNQEIRRLNKLEQAIREYLMKQMRKWMKVVPSLKEVASLGDFGQNVDEKWMMKERCMK